MPLITGLPAGFNQQFAALLRLEPRCRSDDFARGLEARTADPLWMVARQWQTGEFQGEDAGSPKLVELRYSTQSLDRSHLEESGDGQGVPDAPLEALVEQENVGLDWRLRVQIGQTFERRLRSELSDAGIAADDIQTVIDAFRSHPDYGITIPSESESVDQATCRYLEFMAGRAINGEKLLGTVTRPGDVGENQLPDDRLDAALSYVLEEWFPKLRLQPTTTASPAWRSRHLDYRFELNPPDGDTDDPDVEATAPSKTHLLAPDYRNGELDWYTFTAASGLRGDWRAGGKRFVTEYPTRTPIAVVEPMWTGAEETDIGSPLDRATLKPIGIAPVTVRPKRLSVGGTSPRWWAFEDAATNLGALDVAKPDLGKLMLMEFVLIYGDDWFTVPLQVDMANLVRIDELKVKNVFDEEVVIDSVRETTRREISETLIDPGISDEYGDPDDPLLRWEVFTISCPSRASSGGETIGQTPGNYCPSLGDALLIPPVTGFRQESPPIEEVRFLRDEGANMVWGVEHTVPNGLGRPRDGFSAQLERIELRLKGELAAKEQELLSGSLSDDARAELEDEVDRIRQRLEQLREGGRPHSAGIPLYRLASTVPENWIPFMPTSARPFFNIGHNAIRLRRAQMLRNVDDEEPTPIPAMSRLLELSGQPLLWLEESTVPRAGLRVRLTGQRVRWVDGKTYVWYGRSILTGLGEGSSGLKFDEVK